MRSLHKTAANGNEGSPVWRDPYFLFRRSVEIFFFVSIVSLGLFASKIAAQNAPVQIDTEPPPLKVLSKAEKQELDAQTDAKKHTALALDLMNSRLTKAEELNGKEQFEDMYKELGGFHALMDNALGFLIKKDADGSKVLYNFKKLEIGLRTFLPRLELIRRDLPARFEPYLKTLIKYIHEAREKAIEPFFGNTVVPNTKSP